MVSTTIELPRKILNLAMQPKTMPDAPHPNADVRMRGFANKVSLEAASTWLNERLAALTPPSTEQVPLERAAGRVLTGDVVSRINVPEFERAMMDGFAVRAADIEGASQSSPVPLQVLGEAFPGEPFPGVVTLGTCVRTMTGAALPAGVDAVLPVEFTSGDAERVFAQQPISPGKNVGSIGEDIQAGETVLSAGRLLRPQDIGVLSSIGVGQVDVIKRPRVRIVVTGDELLPAGSQPHGCRIVDANGPMLTSLVRRDGGQADFPGIVPDNREAILAALQDDAEVILVSGGSSVGEEDHVPTLLAEHGELAVHGINMRPASPLGMGRLGDRLVFLLPGNPVACLCGYDFFAGVAIRACGGRPTEWPYRTLHAALATAVKSPSERVDYLRVQLRNGQVQPVPKSGASVLSSTTMADGFLIIPSGCEGYEEGVEIEVFLYD